MRSEFINKARDLEQRSRSFRYYFTLVLALLLIFFLIFTRLMLGNQLDNFSEQSGQLISNTKETLTIIEKSLPNINTTLTYTQISIGNLRTTGEKLPDLLDNVGTLIGSDFADLATEGQKSLETAANSAKIIDETLSFLSRIPFLNLNYDPEQPLEKGLRDLSASFSLLPANLQQIESDLDSATENISGFSDQLDPIDESINEVLESVQGLKLKFVAYQTTLDTINNNVLDASGKIQNSLTIFLIILILLILLWIADRSLSYFANLEPVSGTIPSERRSEISGLGDNTVSDNKNKGEK